MHARLGIHREWLEPDGLGGFASGTVGLVRTRRYHGLLLSATTPPTGRMLLVHGCEAHVLTDAGRFALSAQQYVPDVIYPEGRDHLQHFEATPFPRWTFELPDGTHIEQTLFACHGQPRVVMHWRLLTPGARVRLELRPLLSGRDYHALHHENAAFRFAAESRGQRLRFQPYTGVPAVLALSNGQFEATPDWYRNFQYAHERERGLDDVEDLACPGVIRYALDAEPAVLILQMEAADRDLLPERGALAFAERCERAELERRAAFASPLQLAADAYIVERGAGKTIIAGYPWFTDWGRDTFIALRGLCLATGRYADALAILLEWAGAVSEGMLPNRFADAGGEPEYNSVDASLWYVIAVHELWQALAAHGGVTPRDRERLRGACQAILEGYARGTRHGIAMDDDGLLAAGFPGSQLTWMDAKIGDWAVTPRTGKPVEVQALWINALAAGASWSRTWRELQMRAAHSFERRFWNHSGACLYDVVDVEHRAGVCDGSIRPNQIFAVGGLPLGLLDHAQARQVVTCVEERLLTPFGLRSLAPTELGYAAAYSGGPRERDAVYHQGTVWPWLIGPFVEAWVRVRGHTQQAREEARLRFLTPLLDFQQREGLGHLCEITDAEPPHAPRGCPAQAWSVSELLRLDQLVLAREPAPRENLERPSGGREPRSLRSGSRDRRCD